MRTLLGGEKVLIVAGAAVVVAFSLVLVFWVRSPQRARPAVEGAQAAVPRPASDPVDLSHLLMAIRNLNNRISELETRETVEEPAVVAPPDYPSPEEFAVMRDEAIARVQVYDQALADEARDAQWASVMEESIDVAFRDGDFSGTEIVDSECKETFCRLEVRHESASDYDKFELIKRSIPGNYMFQQLDPDSDGTPRTVAYFVREGRQSSNVIFRSREVEN